MASHLAVSTVAAFVLLGGSAQAQDPAQHELKALRAGACSLRLTPQQVAFFKPKGEGFIAWVGPCENGFAHGAGILLQRRKDAKDASWRYAVRYTAADGRLGGFLKPLYIGDGSVAWKDAAKAKETVRVEPAQLPAWASYVLGDGPPTQAHLQAARDFLRAELRAARAKPAPSGPPPGTELADAGACKVYIPPAANRRSLNWRGGCVDGLAGGLAHGNGLLEIVYANSRVIKRMTAEQGRLAGIAGETYSVHDQGTYSTYGKDNKWARIEREDLPQWTRHFLDTHPVAAAPPPGTELMDAGSCKLYLKRHADLRSLNWRGGCASGMADGAGLLEIINGNNRVIQKLTASHGRLPDVRETYSIHDNGGTSLYSTAQDKWLPIAREQLPPWAAGFLNAHAVLAAAPSEDDALREQAEERRRRREEEREEREERREREREERDRSNIYMEAMGAVLKGAAEGRRQQREAQERRQAQVADIERQNARYREQRASEDRRRIEQQQQRERAQVELQRAQEFQRQQVARAEPVRAQPRWERVNLPAHTGCISVEWRPSSPKNVEQWYEVKNSCPFTLNVHWCDRQGCRESSAMATIAGGGSTRSWTLKKHGPSVSVVIACQVENGGATVHYDRRNDQCWSNVKMQ